MYTMNEKLAYAAGFFDGEGSVGIGIVPGLRVTVAQTQTAPLIFMQELFGGSIKELHRPISGKAHWKRCWHWSLAAWNASDFLVRILPALKVKYVEAAMGILFQDTRILTINGTPVSRKVAELRQYLVIECAREKKFNV